VLDGVGIPRSKGQFRGENVICTANGWLKEQLKEQEQQFCRALEKRRTKCISVAENYVEK